jgi:hypothetical protein
MPKGQTVQGNGYVSYWDTLKTAPAPLPNFGTLAGETSNVLAGVYTNQVLQDASGNTILQNATPGILGTMSANSPRSKDRDSST